MKLKPIYKTQKNNSWILEYLPKKYQDMIYCEPFCTNGSILFNKKPSVEEAINNPDESIVKIFRNLRDRPKEFTSKLKKIKYNSKTVTNIQNFVSEDGVDLALKELLLRRLSINGDKSNFDKDNKDWNGIIDQIPYISNRLNLVHIICKPANKFIEAFDSKNTIFFIEAPNSSVNKVHTDLFNCVKRAKGNFIVSSSAYNLYNSLYVGWKKIRRKTYQKFDYLWLKYSSA